MRILLALTLFASACTSNPPAGGPDYASVRDRLSDRPARLFVGGEISSGSITARRWTADGWVEGQTAVTIDAGEVSAKLDPRGAFVVDTLVIGLAPIDIPEEVFKKPAQLDDVTVTLTAPATAMPQWSSDNAAAVALPVSLDFDWSIRVNGGKTPLATQHLPPIVIDLTFTGGGDHVDATVRMHASGELWNWAGLLEMTSLDLSVAAGTVD
jgi:hypothetical protein